VAHFPSLSSPEIQEKLSKIKLLICDVDGVLTNGCVTWIKDQGWTRTFNVKDGYGLKRAQASGVKIALITAGSSQDVKERATLLNVDYFYSGTEDKITQYEKLMKETGLKDEEVAYIADDLFDIPILERVGLAVTVPTAVNEVKAIVHYIVQLPGGTGATRELTDALVNRSPRI